MFNPETGKRIHLTHGAGNGIDSACLMTASNMLIGRGQDGDNNSCVCPVITEFIIRTNDAIPENMLGELYGPLAWEILGTATGDPEIERQRAYRFADWSVREIAPAALWAVGLGDHAAKLETLSPVVDQQTADAARVAARSADAARVAARSAFVVTYAARAVAYAARAVAYAADAVADAARVAARSADAVTYAARAVAYAARAAAFAAYAADAELIWRKCPEIIREVASIGDRRPVETVIDHCDLAAALAN